MERFFALLFLTIIVLSGCGGGGGGSSNTATSKVLTSIAIVPEKNNLAIGKTRQFTATGTYSDGSTQDLTGSVTWSSADTTISTITPNGMATSIAAGETTITATNGSISSTTTLTIPPTTLVTITIDPANPVMAAGTTQKFTAKGIYSDGSTQDMTGLVTWSSASTSIASITSSKATAIAIGSTTITATLGSVSGTTTLNVTSATLQSIAVTPTNVSIAAGTTRQFTATGTLSNSTTQDLTGSARWSSSDTAVATIDATSGIATAVGAGSTTIAATLGNVSDTATLNVTSATLQSIAVTPTNVSIAAGTTRQFTATGTLSNSATQDLTRATTWRSSDTTVATIDATSGIATAVGLGSATITATSEGKSGSTPLAVTPLVVNGTWTGTYTIYDNPSDPAEIGTYTFQLVLNQNGATVTGEAILRENMAGQLSATGQLTGNVDGRQMSFSLTYISPNDQNKLTDIGTATITDNTMIGSVIENYLNSYNCSYIFTLTRNP